MSGKRKRRLLIAAIALVVICAAAGYWFFHEPTYDLTVSPETTYLTEPLLPDGRVDYAAAIEARLSAGVTPDNNAAVLIVRALGPEFLQASDREFVLRELGLPYPPPAGESLLGVEEYVNALPYERIKQEAAATSLPNAIGNPTRRLQARLVEQREVAIARPWTSEEFPILAEWIESNQVPLDLLVEASRRPRYHIPYRCDGSAGSLPFAIPQIRFLSEKNRTLTARAMLRAAQGDTDGAMEDLLACHRLARLYFQRPPLLEHLVAPILDIQTSKAEVALVNQCELSPAQLRDYLEKLNRLSPIPIAGWLEGYRFLNLNHLQNSWKLGLDVMFNDPDASGISVNWDKVARNANAHFDAAQAAASLPTWAERQAEMRHIDDEVARRRNAMSSASLSWLGKVFGQSEQIRALRRDPEEFLYLNSTVPLHDLCKSSENARAQFEVTRLAVALALHKAETGSFPDKLDALAPEYLPSIPLDHFTDLPLHYQRTGEGYLLYSVGPDMHDNGGQDDTDDVVAKSN